MNKHQKGAVRMIKYIFPKSAFLDLCDKEGQLVGKTPQQIIKNLQENFFDDEETKEEILKIYKKMNMKYNPDDMVQVYFKALQDARTILVSLYETITNRFLICQVIDQFNKHMDPNKAADEWEKIAPQKTWKNSKCTLPRQ